MEHDDIYCYNGTDVLINKYAIKDASILNMFERQITSSRRAELEINPVEGQFDFNHLKAIHQRLFADIYDWAGQIRRVNIAKSNLFCRYQFIDSMATNIFDSIKKDNFLKNLPKEQFVKKLSFYMGEINALHPFREGNGRTQRTFFIQLSEKAGYCLSLAHISGEKLLDADISAMKGHYEKLEQILMANIYSPQGGKCSSKCNKSLQ